MNIKISRSIVFPLSVLLAVSSFVYAQTPNVAISTSSSAQAQQQGSGVQAVAIADVNIVDVVVQEKNGTYTGKYNLQGGMGRQNGVQIGILAYDEKRNIVDVVTLLNDVSVQEGELRPLTISYTPPKHLTGTITFYLRAETKEGLPLSQALLGTKKLTAKAPTFTCKGDTTATTSPKVTCTSTAKDTLTLSTAQGSVFNQQQSRESKEVTGGGKAVFSPTLPPGKYFAFVSSQATGAMYALKVSASGVYASFLSVMVNDTNPGVLTVTALSRIDGMPQAKVVATLLSAEGKACGTGEQVLEAFKPVAVLDIKTSCTNGTLSIALMDMAGKTLDNRNEAFSVVSVQQLAEEQETKSKNASAVVMLYVGLGVLLLAAFVVLGVRLKKAPESSSSSPVTPTEETSKASETVAV